MRLLHTSTLKFEVFFDEQIPPYAILSHRWEGQEISYQDFLKRRKRHGKGFAKVKEFCRFAKIHGHTWVWIDTCCIDKKSSAELTNSVNAMFRYYEDSTACYAYLSDVPPAAKSNQKAHDEAFRNSEWWERGWTLQELLAPFSVTFCDRSWNILGGKDDLADNITAITGIHKYFLISLIRFDRRASRCACLGRHGAAPLGEKTLHTVCLASLT